MREHNWPVTFCVGVVTLQDNTINIEEIVNVTDKLMYLAKKGEKQNPAQSCCL